MHRRKYHRSSDTASTRTGLMLHHRRDITFVGSTPHIAVAQQTTPVITRDTRQFDQRLYSAGASSQREVIDLNPHSPVLLQTYTTLVAKIKSSKKTDTRSILSLIISTTRACFTSTDIDRLVDTHIATNKVISLDVFLSERKGVCRHHALLNAFFLSCLIRDGYLKGSTVHHRQNLPDKNAHTWNVFICQRDRTVRLYSVDSMWDRLVCVSEPHERLPSGYGEGTKRRLEQYLPQRVEERTFVRQTQDPDDAAFFSHTPLLESKTTHSVRPFLSRATFPVDEEQEEILASKREPERPTAKVVLPKPQPAPKPNPKPLPKPLAERLGFFSDKINSGVQTHCFSYDRSLTDIFAKPETVLNVLREAIEETTFAVSDFWILKGGVSISYESGTNTRVPHSIAAIHRLLIEQKYHRLKAEEAIEQVRKIVQAALASNKSSRAPTTTEFYTWMLKELPPPPLVVEKPASPR